MLPHLSSLLFFFFNDTATTEIYTLSLHDALPICLGGRRGWQGRRALGQHLQRGRGGRARGAAPGAEILGADRLGREGRVDRKSTRLNSSHSQNSYAVFCLEKKKKNKQTPSSALSI